MTKLNILDEVDRLDDAPDVKRIKRDLRTINEVLAPQTFVSEWRLEY